MLGAGGAAATVCYCPLLLLLFWQLLLFLLLLTSSNNTGASAAATPSAKVVVVHKDVETYYVRHHEGGKDHYVEVRKIGRDQPPMDSRHSQEDFELFNGASQNATNIGVLDNDASVIVLLWDGEVVLVRAVREEATLENTPFLLDYATLHRVGEQDDKEVKLFCERSIRRNWVQRFSKLLFDGMEVVHGSTKKELFNFLVEKATPWQLSTPLEQPVTCDEQHVYCWMFVPENFGNWFVLDQNAHMFGDGRYVLHLELDSPISPRVSHCELGELAVLKGSGEVEARKVDYNYEYKTKLVLFWPPPKGGARTEWSMTVFFMEQDQSLRFFHHLPLSSKLEASTKFVHFDPYGVVETSKGFFERYGNLAKRVLRPRLT